MAGHTYTITKHDPIDDTDEEIAERVALGNLITAEVFPDEEPTPVEQAIAAQRSVPARIRRWSFRARDDQGRLVAAARTSIDPGHDDNPDVLGVGIHVHPDHRRRGLATRLLAELVHLAKTEGRARLMGETASVVAGSEEFARATGASDKSWGHVNTLPLAEVDRAMLERWAAEGPQRAADYELLAWDGPIPDEHAEAFVDLVLVMNTAPRDDFEVNDFTFTVEQLRDGERVRAAAGIVTWTLVARRRSDGALAGFHDISMNPAQPRHAWVGATGVRPEHRGHALGKWLKAAMTLRVLDERPHITEIRTGNADSNDAMLGINRLMGYRPLVAFVGWELPVPVAEKWLADRGALLG